MNCACGVGGEGSVNTLAVPVNQLDSAGALDAEDVGCFEMIAGELSNAAVG